MQIDSAVFAAAAACVTLIGTLGGGFYFSGKVSQKLDEHSEARKTLTEKLDRFIETINAAALDTVKLEKRIEHAEENIGRVDNTVEDLRRGRGWITNRDVRIVDPNSVNREYGQ
jgi:hypothetical protein